MSVRETLELDIAEALASIQEVGSRLDNVARAFGEQLQASLEEAMASLPIIKVGADASEVTSEIDEAVDNADSDVVVNGDATEVTSEIDEAVVAADTDVVIDGDASGITPEIEAAVDEADTQVDVTVNVDTGSAVSDLDAVSESAEGASGSVGGAAAAGAVLSKQLSGDSTKALGRFAPALTAVGPAAAAAATGVGAVVIGTKFLYDAAFEAVAVTQQWESSLGDLGASIMDLESGTTGFSGTLAELAQNVGSSDEAVLQATQRYATFQRSAGLADDQIVENTQNIAVLAAQIRVTNPSIGTMDQIITGLSRGLQRGGPRMQAYGLSIDTTSLALRAMQMSGKATAAELTNADKSAAGLAMAMEQLMPTTESVEDGMSNVAVMSARASEKFGDALEVLGEPLVIPLTQALLEFAMVFEQVAGFVARGVADIQGFTQTVREDAPVWASLLNFAAPDGQSWLELGRDIRGTDDDVQTFRDSAFATQIVTASLADELRRNALETQLSDARWQGFSETLTAARDRIAMVQAEFGDLTAAAVANVPTVNAAFDGLSAEVGTMQILADLDAAFAATVTWTDSMTAQLAVGNDSIVALMSELGPEKSAILLATYDGDLAQLEAHLDRLYLAELNAQLRARQTMVLHYLEAQGITGEQAQAIVDELGATLILEDPTADSVEAAAKKIDEARWAAASATQAQAAWRALIAERVEFVRAGQSVGDGFVEGMVSKLVDIRNAGVQMVTDAYLASKGKARINSPSLLFADLGNELVEGLALGLNDTTLAVTSSQQLVSAVATPLERAALSAPAGIGGTVAPANISVTVPVTVTAGMTADDGRRIGEAAGQAAEMELRRVYRMEAMLA